jgi:hypothetical protein
MLLFVFVQSLVEPQAAFAQVGEGRQVGIASAVNASAQARFQDDQVHILQAGYAIERDEVIETDDTGEAQLLFNDGSSVTAGRRAALAVNDFVYDPASQRGHLGLDFSKGVFRFVGGHLSKDGSVSVRTPTALLGIRGAIVMIEVVPDTGDTLVTMLFGDRVMVSGSVGGPQEITTIGYSSFVARGAAPTTPRRIAPDILRRLSAGLEPKPQKAPGQHAISMTGAASVEAEVTTTGSASASPSTTAVATGGGLALATAGQPTTVPTVLSVSNLSGSQLFLNALGQEAPVTTGISAGPLSELMQTSLPSGLTSASSVVLDVAVSAVGTVPTQAQAATSTLSGTAPQTSISSAGTVRVRQ